MVDDQAIDSLVILFREEFSPWGSHRRSRPLTKESRVGEFSRPTPNPSTIPNCLAWKKRSSPVAELWSD